MYFNTEVCISDAVPTCGERQHGAGKVCVVGGWTGAMQSQDPRLGEAVVVGR